MKEELKAIEAKVRCEDLLPGDHLSLLDRRRQGRTLIAVPSPGPVGGPPAVERCGLEHPGRVLGVVTEAYPVVAELTPAPVAFEDDANDPPTGHRAPSFRALPRPSPAGSDRLGSMSPRPGVGPGWFTTPCFGEGAEPRAG